jgi:tellurite resistance protein
MSNGSRSLGAGIVRQVVKLRDDTLLEGAMATGALVALADRRLAIEESIALQDVLANTERLQIHDPEFAMTLYTRHVDRLRQDFATGKQAALEAIGRCSDDIDAALLIVRVGIAIAKADKVIAASELEVIEEICDRIGIEGLDTLGLAGGAPSRLH